MMNLDDYIKYHTAIDFKRYGESVSLSLLKESMQHIDNISIYTNSIVKKLIDFIESSDKMQIDLSKLIIYKKDIPLDFVFFDELHFTKSFFVVNDNDKTPVDMAGYLPNESGVYKDKGGNSKYIVTFRIDTVTSLEYIKEAYSFLFAHELAHAYEDYCRNSNTTVEDKSTKYEHRFRPGHVYKALGSENKILRNFAEVLYFSFDSEVVAMKNEIYQELVVNRMRMTDFDSANEELKTTRVYKRLITMQDNLNSINKIDDYEIQADLLDLYNNTFETCVVDYNILMTKVIAKFTNARNRIISAAGNYLYFAYCGRNNVWAY